MARLCHRALRRLSAGRRVGAGLKRALGVLRAFTFAMDEHGAWRFNIDVKAVTGVADSGDPEADIVELLAEVGAAAAQHGSGAAFLLDELQFLGRRSLATLAAAMHGVSQQNTPVLLVGAGLPQLPLMLKNAKPYTERLFEYRTIGGLPRPTAATALTVPAQRAAATFDQDALDLILDRADGYPYFLQQWGETVWREAEGPTIVLRDAEGPPATQGPWYLREPEFEGLRHRHRRAVRHQHADHHQLGGGAPEHRPGEPDGCGCRPVRH